MADIKIYGTLKNVTNEPIANAEQIGNLATVATSGSYNDLNDKPTIPSKTSELNNDSKFVSENALTNKQDVLTVPYVANANFSAIANAYYNLLKFNNLTEAFIELPQNAKVNTDVVIFLFRTGTPGQDETLNIDFYCNGYSTIFPSGFEFEPATTYEIEFRRTGTYEWNPVKINNLTKYIKVPTSISQLLEDSKHRTITDDEKSDYTYAAEQFIKYGIINLTNEISKWEYGTTVNVAYDGLFVFENYFIANTTGMVPINVYVNLKRNNETIYLIDKQIPTYSHIILNESFNVKEGDIITFQCSDSFGIESENKAYLKYIVSQKNLPTKTSELTNDSGFLTQHQDITGKADKVINPTNGNFAALDSNGNLTDSGHKHSDYLTQHQDLSNYVQKSQTAGLLKNDGTVDTNQYLTQHQDISGKANKNEMNVVPGTGVDVDKTTITLKQGMSATVLTTHQDISGKENAMPIATATGETLTAVVGNYYRLDNVGTLAITLPTIVGATKLQAITFLIVCSSSALITFVPQGSETILYQEDFALEADTTYEVTALWNGSEWTLSRVIYK